MELCLFAIVAQPILVSVVKRIRGRGVRRAGRIAYEYKILVPLILQAILRLLIISITTLDLIAFLIMIEGMS